MKILLVTQKSTRFVTSRLLKEAKERKHTVTHVNYEDLKILMGEKILIQAGKRALKEHFSAVILRMAGPGKTMVYYKDILARHFAQMSFVLNGNSYIKWPLLGKIMQNYLLSQNGVPIVKSDLYASPDWLDKDEYQYPIIAKRDSGKLGKDVSKINDKRELTKILGKGISQFLLQPFLPTGEDYRVIVLGGRALPRVMKKIAPEGGFITNISQGGKAIAKPLTDELKTLSEKAAAVFEADFCGVDIMYGHDGKPHVFEINRSANFEGFEKSTGINVAVETIKLLERKIK